VTKFIDMSTLLISLLPKFSVQCILFYIWLGRGNYRQHWRKLCNLCNSCLGIDNPFDNYPSNW